MNFKSKIKLILNVVVKSKFKDFKELFSLLKFLLLGGKIFIIFSARIGHQLLNPLAFLSKITPEESSKYKFAISNPKVKYLEIPMMKLDITDEIMDTKIEIIDGKVKKPDVVGIGVNITEDIKEKYKLVTDSNYRI